MTPKLKAKDLVDKMYYSDMDNFESYHWELAKKCALISVVNEYTSNRELLYNLMSCGVIESEKVYLVRLQGLIDEENEVKSEIEKL